MNTEDIFFRGFTETEEGYETIRINKGIRRYGKWVCGSYLRDNTICQNELGYDDVLKQPAPKFVDYLVIPETVGQYIFKTDSNGEKLYVGDVVWSSVIKDTIEIIFDEKEGKFLLKNEKYTFGAYILDISEYYWVRLGTIFDDK